MGGYTMIDINEFKLPITPEQGRNILQKHTDTFGCFFDLDKILEYESMYALHVHKSSKEWRALAGDPYLQITKRYDVLRVIVERFGVPEYKLNFEGKVSLKEEVVNSLLGDPEIIGDAHKFIEMYADLSDARYMQSYLQQYKNLPVCKGESFDKHRMVIAHPEWRLLSTSRISASKPSLQNVNRDISDIYTAPQGYQIIFSDSEQIEPRITYSHFIRDDLITALIAAYDDAYFGLLHYILLSPSEEDSLRENNANIKTNEITPEMEAARKTLKVLSLAGNYGSSNLAAVDVKLGPIYEQKIVNHPARLKNESDIRKAVRGGADTFYGVFGTPIRPDATDKYDRGGRGWYEHLVRCGINNPVQTTASELMLFSLYNSSKLLGLDGFINYYKHDEGSFYVVDDKVDELAPKLRDCLSYKVKDWIPIGSDLKIGKKSSGYESLF
jgi:DNA polymerase I-like protein with 3'-5' exonuclease and polymerase domains